MSSLPSEGDTVMCSGCWKPFKYMEATSIYTDQGWQHFHPDCMDDPHAACQAELAAMRERAEASEKRELIAAERMRRAEDAYLDIKTAWDTDVVAFKAVSDAARRLEYELGSKPIGYQASVALTALRRALAGAPPAPAADECVDGQEHEWVGLTRHADPVGRQGVLPNAICERCSDLRHIALPAPPTEGVDR